MKKNVLEYFHCLHLHLLWAVIYSTTKKRTEKLNKILKKKQQSEETLF